MLQGEGAVSVCQENWDQKRNVQKGDIYKVEEVAGQPRPAADRALCARPWPACSFARLRCGRGADRNFAGRGDYRTRGVRAAGRDDPASPRRWPDARESLTGARLSPHSRAKRGFPADSFVFKAKPNWRLRVNTFEYNGLRQGDTSLGPCRNQRKCAFLGRRMSKRIRSLNISESFRVLSRDSSDLFKLWRVCECTRVSTLSCSPPPPPRPCRPKSSYIAMINIPVDHLIDYLPERSRGLAVISFCLRLPFHFYSSTTAPNARDLYF